MTRFASFVDRLNSFLLEHSRSKLNLYNIAVEDLIKGGGKRLRPILMNLASHFGDYRVEKMLPIAAGVELLHMATLVHDDIIDRAKLRRGRVTIQQKYGNNIAVFVGDYLLSKSYILFSQDLSRHCLNKLNRVVRLICEGEIQQYQSRYNNTITFRDYLRRIRKKTALLFGLSTYTGAYESGLRGKLLYNLYNVGLELGMAFQIQDDLLDFIGEQGIIGKGVHRDILDGIYTLPVILLFNDPNYSMRVREIFAHTLVREEQLARINSLIEEGEFIKKSQKIGYRFLDRAINHLDSLPANRYKEDLRYIINWQLKRTN